MYGCYFGGACLFSSICWVCVCIVSKLLFCGLFVNIILYNVLQLWPLNNGIIKSACLWDFVQLCEDTARYSLNNLATFWGIQEYFFLLVYKRSRNNKALAAKCHIFKVLFFRWVFFYFERLCVLDVKGVAQWLFFMFNTWGHSYTSNRKNKQLCDKLALWIRCVHLMLSISLMGEFPDRYEMCPCWEVNVSVVSLRVWLVVLDRWIVAASRCSVLLVLCEEFLIL